jgi:DHA1 family inner membrane transport protein
MPPILYFFALCNLVIGTGAFLLGGIVRPISESLDISVAAAGQAMTAYAIATAVLAPMLIVLTSRWSRKRAIELALLLFTVGALICALAPNLLMLLLGRVMMGAGAMFTAAAAALTVSMVAPALRGRALSITFLGTSVSYAVGIPIGAWLGFEYGWRVPVGLAAVASLGALLLANRLVPANMASAGAGFVGFREAALQPAVWLVWLRTLLHFVAIFSVFAYIGPVLQALNPMSSGELSLTLAAYGLAGIAGTLSGGWANDRFGAIRSSAAHLTLMVLMMALLPLTQGRISLTLLTLMIWGMAGFGMLAPQQSRLAGLSATQAPLLLSLNGSMVYVGTALGSVISGALIGTLGFDKLSWVGLPFGLLALLTLAFEQRPGLSKAQASKAG